MINNDALLSAYKACSAYYTRLGKYENRYPGSIGFVDSATEIYVKKERMLARLFCPHFYLYNHETGCTQSFKFRDIDTCDQYILDFLNTVRLYSIDSNQWPLIRTYYDDLVSEWEVVNKRRFQRKFMCK